MQALEHNKQLQHVEPGEMERLDTKRDQRVSGLIFENHLLNQPFKLPAKPHHQLNPNTAFGILSVGIYSAHPHQP